MSQLQSYEVSYNINVEASKGVEQVQQFARSIESLAKFRNGFGNTVTNVQSMMADLDKIFPARKGNGREFVYNFSLNTKDAVVRLKLIKKLMDEIKTAASGVNVSVNAGKVLQSNSVKKNAATLIVEKNNAVEAVKDVEDTQKIITKTIGKINAALIHLQTPREIEIKTVTAENNLQRVLGLLRQIRGESRSMTLGMGGSVPSFRTLETGVPGGRVFQLPANYRIMPVQISDKTQPAGQSGPKQIIPPESIEAIRNAARGVTVQQTGDGKRQRAAINRLQYSQPASINNLMPFAYMLNAYTLYSGMRSELTEAVEYANIMESARSILKVADKDLGTFNTRFEAMATNVRKVGIETKFTAVEVGGAVKYLAMAGQSIDAINKSIRPISNLALIGDNDISQIADLTTNIMAGYDIRPESMNSVADIIASTISRTNVNILETAESFKMSAGFLQNAGVEFSESSAAVGLLGNMGVKATMAGTSLRAMAIRLASQPREAEKVIDRLGIQLYRYEVMYGKRVQMMRPLADIFEDLNKKGATSEDIYKIFGKVGGNAGIMFLNNYDKLRELTIENRASHGISEELAQVKQETTKGLWYQMTSQFSEIFMQSYEILEPKIRSILRDFISKFKAPEFARGLASLANALLDVFSVLGKIATWIGRNFNWLEPLLFTGIVATKLFKLAGAVINLGVALGFLGKQSIAASSIQAVTSLAGLGGAGVTKAISFAQKRALVTELTALGISGKGAMTQALTKAGLTRATTGVAVQGAASGLFATQVATGRGLVGAGASIGALGATAVAATAGIALLAGAVGWVAYKTWKLKEAKDAVLEDVDSKKKYRYESLDALNEQMDDIRENAVKTKSAIDDLTGKTQLKDNTGQTVGALTGRWWMALNSTLWHMTLGPLASKFPQYTFRQARLDNLTQSIETYADTNVQNSIESAFADLGRLKDPLQIRAFMRTAPEKYTLPESNIDSTLMTKRWDGTTKYVKNGRDMTLNQAQQTAPYVKYYNLKTLKPIQTLSSAYLTAMSSYEGAKSKIEEAGLNFSDLEDLGFYRDKKGQWVQKELPANATDEDRTAAYTNFRKVRDALVQSTTNLRESMGGSALIATNIMEKAGFSSSLYSNEPLHEDPEPFNRNDISSGADDGGAGGNYSGTGKLSSSAPKQVIVNITNLLSVETIDLLKTPDGQKEEIQNLKEQMAQALIDVVHDFDSSWNV